MLYSSKVYHTLQLSKQLRRVKLKGKEDGQAIYPWADAAIQIKQLPVENIHPTQTYVIRKRVEELHEVYRQLYEVYQSPLPVFMDLEICASGTSERQTYPFTLPIVESDPALVEPNHYILCDGMHRCYAQIYGKYKRRYIWCIVITNGLDTLEKYPYYADPLPEGWLDVRMVDEPPPVKKSYRRPDDYKFLFRLLNDQFPGIQEKRG